MPDSSFADFIWEAVSTYLGAEEPAIVTGFVLAVEAIDSEGRPTLSVLHPQDQTHARSLGLASYATEWIKDDIVSSFCQLREGE